MPVAKGRGLTTGKQLKIFAPIHRKCASAQRSGAAIGEFGEWERSRPLTRLSPLAHRLPRARIDAEHFRYVVMLGVMHGDLSHQPALFVVYHVGHPRGTTRLLKAAIIDPRDRILAQIGLKDLAHGGLGQLVHDLEVLWLGGPFGDMLARKGEQFLFGDLGALHQFDEGTGHLARMGVGLADGARKGDGLMAQQRLFDLGGVDVVTATDDQVFGAARNPEVFVAVDTAQIPCAQVRALIVEILVLIGFGIGIARIDAGVRDTDLADLVDLCLDQPVACLLYTSDAADE